MSDYHQEKQYLQTQGIDYDNDNKYYYCCICNEIIINPIEHITDINHYNNNIDYDYDYEDEDEGYEEN